MPVYCPEAITVLLATMRVITNIVIDSLSLPVSSSGSGTGGNNNARPISIIDLPDSASYAQHCQF